MYERQSAIENYTQDQKDLEEAAFHDPDMFLRGLAAERVKSQAVQMQLLLTSPSQYARDAAAFRVHDLKVLRDKAETDYDLRAILLRRIIGDGIFTKFDEYPFLAWPGVKLRRLWPNDLKEAEYKIDASVVDAPTLKRWAIDPAMEQASVFACLLLTDQSALADIFRSAHESARQQHLSSPTPLEIVAAAGLADPDVIDKVIRIGEPRLRELTLIAELRRSLIRSGIAATSVRPVVTFQVNWGPAYIGANTVHTLREKLNVALVAPRDGHVLAVEHFEADAPPKIGVSPGTTQVTLKVDEREFDPWLASVQLPSEPRYYKFDPYSPNVVLQAAFGSVSVQDDGEAVISNGVVREFTIGGQDIELASDKIGVEGKRAVIVTKKYGEMEVHVDSHLRATIWVTPSQRAELLRLR